MEAFEPQEPPTFEQLMLPHMDSAYNLARWLLRDPHEADDAVQEAFLRAFKAFGRFRGSDGRAWLLTIVRNVCYSAMRAGKNDRMKETFSDEVHGSSEDAAASNAVAWVEVRSDLLNRALERLPAEFREVIVLHEIEGLAYRQISDVADIPLGTVMSRLARARGKLQAEILGLAKEGGLK
jgi:RNA polymerase sigma-70 factor (ECF subfamily)